MLLQRIEEFRHLCDQQFDNVRAQIPVSPEAIRSIESKGYELHSTLREARIFGSPAMQKIVEDIEESIGGALYSLDDPKAFEKTWNSFDPTTGVWRGVVYAFMEFPDEIFSIAQADLAAHNLRERWAYWRRGRSVVRQRRKARRRRLKKEREKERAVEG
jgi:hypothetical protein